MISAGVVKIDEEGDDDAITAILSKKPLGGNSCASCERKI